MIVILKSDGSLPIDMLIVSAVVKEDSNSILVYKLRGHSHKDLQVWHNDVRACDTS